MRVGISTEAADAIAGLLAEYDEGISDVEVEAVTYGSGRYEAARDDFLRGDFDVVMLDDIWIPRYADQGALLPLEGRAGDVDLGDPDFDRRFVGQLSRWSRDPRGRLVGLPFVANVLVAFQRRGEAHSFPFHTEHTSTLPIPIGIRNDTRSNVVEVFVEAMRAFDPAADPLRIGPDEPLELDRDAAEAALRWMWESLQPAQGAIRTETELARDLCAGRSAVIIGWPLWVDAPGSCLGTAPVVSGLRASAVSSEPVLGAWFLAVRRDSSHRTAATRLVVELTTSAHWQERLGNAGGFIPVLDRVQPTTLRDHRFWQPNYQSVVSAFQAARPRTRTVRWVEIEEALGASLERALAADSADEAVASWEPPPDLIRLGDDPAPGP